MLNSFSDDYKRALIEAENKVKSNGFKEVMSEDVFLEIIRSQNGNVWNIFNSF